MPELPDIVVLARSMNEALCGRVIREVVVNQPKCLNIAPDELGRRLAGRRFESFEQRGKWILARLDDGSTLAFYAGDPGDKDIFLVPVECAEQVEGCGPDALTRLTEGGNNKAPSFSPDGQWIAFASTLRGDNNVFIMRVDGSDWRQLTTQPSADWQPRWGP